MEKKRYDQDENIQLKKDDVLVTKDGTIGKIAYVEWMPGSATLNTGIFVIRPIDNAYFPLYLYYVLSSYYFTKFLNKLKAGSTINHLYQKDFVNFNFPVPPIAEQQKITSILSGVDELIQKTGELVEKSGRLRIGLIQKLLTKGIEHTRFKKTELGPIPDEWNIVKLEDVCSIRKDGNRPNSDIYIGLEHIGQGNNKLIAKGNISDFSSNKKHFRAGDVLYGKLRPLLNKVYLSVEEGYCSTDIFPLVVNDRILNEIVVWNLSSVRFVNHADSNSSGTKMPRIHWKDIKNYRLCLPKKDEQIAIVRILNVVNSQIVEFEKKQKKYIKLKKAIMQKLLTGVIKLK